MVVVSGDYCIQFHFCQRHDESSKYCTNIISTCLLNAVKLQYSKVIGRPENLYSIKACSPVNQLTFNRLIPFIGSMCQGPILHRFILFIASKCPGPNVNRLTGFHCTVELRYSKVVSRPENLYSIKAPLLY